MVYRMNIKQLLIGHHEHKRIQIPRAIVSSLIGASLDYGCMILLIETFDLPVLTAGSAGMIIGLVFVCIAGRYWIYPPVRGHKAAGLEILIFFLLAMIGAALHTAVLSFGLRYIPLHYLLIKAMASLLMFAWNYAGRRASNRWIRNMQRVREGSSEL